jgi:hypothetical protein
MGTIATAVLCYGVEVELVEAPWGDLDVEDWWRNVNDAPEHVRDWCQPLITKYGSYGNIPEDVKSNAVGPVLEWDAANPTPVEFVWHNSHDWPMLILAHPGTVIRAHQGTPYALDVHLELGDNTYLMSERIVEFCKRYGGVYEGEPCWLLCSVYG